MIVERQRYFRRSYLPALQSKKWTTPTFVRRRVVALLEYLGRMDGADIEALDSTRMKSIVTGTAPTVDYPAGSGPWSGNYWLDGPEPPLGYEINAQEPVGTPAEIEASLATTSLCSDAEPSPASSETGVVANPPPGPKGAKLRLKRLPK
jgi:hypothetical protein